MSAPASVLAADVHPWFELDKRAPHLFPTQGRLRYLLRQRERNGLASRLVWLGRTPYIREADLAAWLDGQKRGQP